MFADNMALPAETKNLQNNMGVKKNSFLSHFIDIPKISELYLKKLIQPSRTEQPENCWEIRKTR